ncbi:hypothetical protein ACROYT_G029587 [Oculina patagonica]
MYTSYTRWFQTSLWLYFWRKRTQTSHSTKLDALASDDRRLLSPNTYRDHLISSNAAGFGGPCSTGSHRTLNDGCSISDDCSTITCKMDFVYEPITFKLEINKCDDPVSVTASMDVPDLSITWSHTYTDDDIVEVPGFNASLPAVVSAGVYVQVELTANDDELHLTVKLLAGGEILGKSVYPVKTTVMDGDLPMNTKACGAFAWWYEMNDVSKCCSGLQNKRIHLDMFELASCNAILSEAVLYLRR